MCNILFLSHPKFSLGWDQLGSIKICCSLTTFLFGVGSDGINQDLLLTDQIFLHGGISYFHLNDLLLTSAASTKEHFVSIKSFYILAMPQVFEQSLFLFLSGKERKVKHWGRLRWLVGWLVPWYCPEGGGGRVRFDNVFRMFMGFDCLYPAHAWFCLSYIVI